MRDTEAKNRWTGGEANPGGRLKAEIWGLKHPVWRPSLNPAMRHCTEQELRSFLTARGLSATLTGFIQASHFPDSQTSSSLPTPSCFSPCKLPTLLLGAPLPSFLFELDAPFPDYDFSISQCLILEHQFYLWLSCFSLQGWLSSRSREKT